MTPTLNMAALTRRTGVPPDTIRKWEQRYGVLKPGRTSGGQRRYSERDVARVEWLKARLADGYRIGEAAALLGDSGVVATTTAELRDELVDAVHRSDVQAVRATVEQSLTLESPGTAFTEVLAPALVDIGERWRTGDLTVAQEHLASAAVTGALQRLVADRRGNVRGVAVLACAPGERHEIGLLMLAVLLHADGWQLAYLGPDTPVGEAVELAELLGASALCFSATIEEHARALERELASTRVPCQVLVGGSGTGGPNADAAVAALRA
jgi:MerR family transcriptional regulator, light-induced transcriptional regulator